MKNMKKTLFKVHLAIQLASPGITTFCATYEISS